MKASVFGGWKNALSVFADRRAIIMLFLGFSAGIPILLIFSSLSLWLGEAGIDKKAVTFFSWAALGYSFKFVWAPLIDELPLPLLTKWLGRRRAWLLVAQCLIVLAIVIMAMSDPSQGHSGLIQMAVGAVLLGFSAASQDVVIDAYRIELAPPDMQPALAATYNAGYRLGMIIAGAGALYLASGFGTATGNYIYQAWQYTYLIMAGVMLIGIITTLSVREPVVSRVAKHYARLDYARLVLVFFLSVTTFVLSFIYIGKITARIELNDTFLSFLLESARFLSSAFFAVVAGFSLVKVGVMPQQMARETWVEPIADFFRRYGFKLALTLLLLIGFFRISDILSGVISNVYYQDLNFTKEQIATAVKVYGVLFTLVGGFLGGILSQRFNVMKVMFLGAVLASSTNLIFVGLIKSGSPIADVRVQVNGQQYTTSANEVGAWHIELPNQALIAAGSLLLDTQVGSGDKTTTLHSTKTLAVAHDHAAPANFVYDLSHDNVIARDETEALLVAGQVYNLQQGQQVDSVSVHVGNQDFEANIKADGSWSTVVSTALLSTAAQSNLQVFTTIQGEQASTQHEFVTAKPFELSQQNQGDYAIDVNTLAVIDANDTQGSTDISGKVIVPYSDAWLYFAIIMDNLASGLAGAAFIAFLSSLTSVSFTAAQYAIFSSLMTLTPKILGGYSGTIVANIGYPQFFVMTALVGVPILLLIVLVQSALQRHQSQSSR